VVTYHSERFNSESVREQAHWPLEVTLSPHQAVVSWPASAAGFVLETSATASDGS
jgi:hypothetical protein